MGTRFGNDVSLNGSAAIGSSTLMGTTLAGTTGGGGGSDSNLSLPSELEEGIFCSAKKLKKNVVTYNAST